MQKVVHAALRAGQFTEISFLFGALPQTKSEWNKWKYFNETKGDVGMSRSRHEKKENKKMHTPRHKVIHNPIPTSLFF